MQIDITKDTFDILIIHSEDFREQLWKEINKAETPESFAEAAVRRNGPERVIASIREVRTKFGVSLVDGKQLVNDAMLKVWGKKMFSSL
jgi:ribosomal protein L7/L12